MARETRLRRVGVGLMLAAAAACAAAAVFVSPVSVARLLALSRLPGALAAVLWSAAAVCAASAFFLVLRRDDVRMQQNVALLAGTLVLMLCMTEAALRIVVFRPGTLTLFREDSRNEGRFRLKPNLAVVTSLAGRPIELRTNSHGMRWREVQPQPAGGKKRIAFVGDSFTFGLWADNATKSLVGIADSILSPAGFEALNFGVPGYGLTDVEAIVTDEVLRFRPAYLVLCFYTGNDFLDTYLGPRRYRVSRSGVLDTDWKYVETRIPAAFRGTRGAEPLVTRSYLYGVVRAVAKSIWPHASEATARFTDTSQVDRSYSSNVFWSRAEYPPFADSARAASLEAFARIAEVARRAGVRFAIVSVPSVEQVHLPAAFGAGYDIRRPQRFVEDFARTHGIPYADLLPVLSARAAAGAEPYVRHEGHFQNEGHRIAGEAIADMIRAMDAPQPPATAARGGE